MFSQLLYEIKCELACAVVWVLMCGCGWQLEYVGALIGVCTCVSAIVCGLCVCRCVCVFVSVNMCVVYIAWTSQGHISQEACEDFTAFVHLQAVMNGHPFSRHSPCVS